MRGFRSGFTIVELIITITIMGILLTLAVVNLTSTQVNARDTERKADIEGIQLNLETFYRTDGSYGQNIGYYPSTAIGKAATTDLIRQAFPDIDLKLLQAPGVSDFTQSFIAATNTDTTTTGIAPQPTISQYVYQPLKADGSLCETISATDLCRRYNLYYRLEADQTIYKVTGKHQ